MGEKTPAGQREEGVAGFHTRNKGGLVEAGWVPRHQEADVFREQ